LWSSPHLHAVVFPCPKVDSQAAGCPRQSALRGPIRLRASLSIESSSSAQPRRERFQLLRSCSAMGPSPSCCRWRPWLCAPIERGTTAVGCEVVTRRVQGRVGLARRPCSVEPTGPGWWSRPTTGFAHCSVGGALRDGQIGTSASLRHQTALAVYPSARKRCSILEGNQYSGRHRHNRSTSNTGEPSPSADA
jgi:hypothetical protein